MKFFAKAFIISALLLFVIRLTAYGLFGNVLLDGNFLILVVVPMFTLMLIMYAIRYFIQK